MKTKDVTFTKKFLPQAGKCCYCLSNVSKPRVEGGVSMCEVSLYACDVKNSFAASANNSIAVCRSGEIPVPKAWGVMGSWYGEKSGLTNVPKSFSCWSKQSWGKLELSTCLSSSVDWDSAFCPVFMDALTRQLKRWTANWFNWVSSNILLALPVEWFHSFWMLQSVQI